MILTFLHRASVQWNEHPLSSIFGRVWRRALQTAFRKSNIALVTGHYDENQWHLLHVIIALHKGA